MRHLISGTRDPRTLPSRPFLSNNSVRLAAVSGGLEVDPNVIHGVLQGAIFAGQVGYAVQLMQSYHAT
jgi:hypothetical protein